MLSRELLYTGITRAKKELLIICEPTSLQKGIQNARIKGETLAEKAEYFKGKARQMGQEALSFSS
jgi:ATP-dependent exoDNAse (exonuclease V) alpha subunit